MLYRAMLKRENAKKNGKKAFTLIELIVVIAIIGVLVAILVPTMMGFVTDAQNATAEANARTIYSAATAAYASAVANGESLAQGAADGSGAGTLNAAVKDLLGSQFEGTWSVSWDGDPVKGVISATFTNKDDTTITATYPKS